MLVSMLRNKFSAKINQDGIIIYLRVVGFGKFFFLGFPTLKKFLDDI